MMVYKSSKVFNGKLLKVTEGSYDVNFYFDFRKTISEG